MALVIADRVKETSVTTGTGTYTLAGAVTGFETFASIGDGNTTYYACVDGSGDFEVGIGTYTASGTTLARTTILQSSNSDAAVDWGSGTKTLFCTMPAEKSVFEDASGNITVSGTVDGRDVAADGTKLDGIESGATADQTGSEIATALNGETLTGIASATVTGDLTVDTSTLHVDSTNNRVGIGTTLPDSTVTVNGSSKVYSTNTGNSITHSVTATSTYAQTITLDDVGLSFDNNSALRGYRFSNNGSERMRIDSSGNVGIGTSSNLNDQFTVGTSTDGFTANVSGVVTTIRLGAHDTSGGAGRFDYDRATGLLTYKEGLYNSEGSALLAVTNSGNVGIGTSSPYRTLTVSGDQTTEGLLEITSATPQLLFSVPSGGLDSRIHNDGSGNFIFGTGTNSATPTERMRIDNSGNVGIGTTSPIYDLQIGTYGSDADSTLALASTTTGTGSIRFGDGTSGGEANAGKIVYDHSNNGMQFHTVASERVRIDSSGNVGIGTSSPSFKLDVAGNARASYFALRSNETAPAEASFIYRPSTGVMGFGTASAERMRIDSSGNVGIGESSPATRLEVKDTRPTFRLTSSYDGSWASGDDIARISFFSDDASGIGPHETGFILNESDSGGTSLSGALVFGTAAYNTAATERMRIDSSGNVTIDGSLIIKNDGVSGQGDNNTHFNYQATGVNYIRGVTTNINGTTLNCNARIEMSNLLDMNNYDIYGVDQIFHHGDTNTYMQFHTSDQWRVVTGGAERIEVSGSALQCQVEIRSTANIIAYYSDERLKTKVGNIDSPLDKVMSLEGFYYVENDLAKSYGFDSDKQQVALSAQSVEAVMPEAVHPAPFDTDIDADGNDYSKSGENYLTVDYARLVPLLVEAIKELKAEIDELKNK